MLKSLQRSAFIASRKLSYPMRVGQFRSFSSNKSSAESESEQISSDESFNIDTQSNSKDNESYYLSDLSSTDEDAMDSTFDQAPVNTTFFAPDEQRRHLNQELGISPDKAVEGYKDWQPNPIEIPESTPPRGYSNEDYLFQRLEFERFDKIKYSKWEDPFPKYPEQDSSSDPDLGLSIQEFPKTPEEIQKELPFWTAFDKYVSQFHFISMPNSNTYVYANSSLRPFLRSAIPHIKQHNQYKKVILNAYKTGDVKFVDELIELTKKAYPDTNRIKYDDITVHLPRHSFVPEDQFFEFCKTYEQNMDRWGPTVFNTLINYYEIRGKREEAEKWLALGIKHRAFVDPIGTADLVQTDKRYAENACLIAAGFDTNTYVTPALTKTVMYRSAVYFNFGFLDRLALNTALRYCLRKIRDGEISAPKRLAIQLAYPYDRKRSGVNYNYNICLQPWFVKLDYITSALRGFINSAFERNPKSPYIIHFTKEQTEYIVRKLPTRKRLF